MWKSQLRRNCVVLKTSSDDFLVRFSCQNFITFLLLVSEDYFLPLRQFLMIYHDAFRCMSDWWPMWGTVWRSLGCTGSSGWLWQLVIVFFFSRTKNKKKMFANKNTKNRCFAWKTISPSFLFSFASFFSLFSFVCFVEVCCNHQYKQNLELFQKNDSF